MSEAKARSLRELHQGKLLVLPNAWDEASAELVVEAGFPVVATSSAAVADALGHEDGERAPWREMFAVVARIARAVPVPVTVDAEAGYGLAPDRLVAELLATGAVGCNIEDTDHRAGGLVPAAAHADRLAAIRAAADAAGVPVALNARIDTFLPHSGFSGAERTDEAIRRGRLYRDAGADCVYPIGISSAADLGKVITGVGGPVNGNTGPELDLDTLASLGVARVSFGPRFYRAGPAAMRDGLEELRRAAGMGGPGARAAGR
ncbi:isocitrate lyase/PEP mutase family protein [Amycolatopsis rifamycinica]|uniref:Carboxyvinyl-carboxyphosphonate phosphorylmutase n=1 Tax=Amycolatopsis rifamycinica TaxID=287986 RepID=A0A066TV58_9PSEU|nr:isocitrate lyase/phosphoenolpyruvate mutase family protein [Amycolatopsis rifamycinica]KDN19071.1 carboxyvinyl-carboxyphosphonate phosphorylmutase [Amycolatopsis rifamycinica]